MIQSAIPGTPLVDGTTVVLVTNELDLATVPAFEWELLSAIEQPGRRVVVDLRACEFLDLTALYVLVAASGRLQRRGERLRLVIANRSLLRLFELTAFDRFFDFDLPLAAGS